MTEKAAQPEAFIHFNSDSNQRVLHPLTIQSRQGMSWTVAALEADLVVEIDQEVTIFFDLRHEFMQQSARLTVQETDKTEPEFEIELIGEPCSAESRECYRVVTVMADHWLRLGDEQERCQIVDISATGCAVIARQSLQIGAVIPAGMTHQNAENRGSLCIQSIKELGKDRIRYGMHCIESRDKSENLTQSLRMVSLDVQREQLRRLSGAA